MESILAVGLGEAERISLRSTLMAHELEVQTAAGCLSAFQQLRHRRFAAVVCESTLVDGDWRTVLAHLDLCEPQPRLIVASRLADACLWAEVLNLGGFDVLSTPFQHEDLARTVLHAVLHVRFQGEQSGLPKSAAA